MAPPGARGPVRARRPPSMYGGYPFVARSPLQRATRGRVIPRGNPLDAVDEAMTPDDWRQAPVKAMQQFLHNRGYSIAVDGIRGPETNAAVMAFHNHIHPQVFNRKRGGKSTVPVRGAVAPATTLRGPGAAHTMGKAPKPVRTAPRGSHVAPTRSLGAGLPGAINPALYAQSMVNAQFDPEITEIRRQIGSGKAQGLQNQADISNWFKQLDQFANFANTRYGQQAGQIMSGNDAAATNMGSLFGGSANPAGPEAGTYADINRTQLAQENLAETGFDNQLKQIMQMQGLDMRRRQERSDAAGVTDLSGRLTDLLGAKGASYGKALGDAQQMATQQEAARQSLLLARLMMGPQVAGAQADAALKIAQAQAIPSQAAMAQQQQADAHARISADIARTRAQTASLGQEGKWNMQDKTQRGDLGAALRKGVQGPRGAFRVGPGVAWRTIQNILAEEGLDNDPSARQIAHDVMSQTMGTSHATRQWGAYDFVNGKVVKRGRAYKKRKK